MHIRILQNSVSLRNFIRCYFILNYLAGYQVGGSLASNLIPMNGLGLVTMSNFKSDMHQYMLCNKDLHNERAGCEKWN